MNKSSNPNNPSNALSIEDIYNFLSNPSIDLRSQVLNINFLDQNTGLAGGDKFTFYNQENNGVIYKTTNVGVNWNVVFSDTNLIINNTYFLNDTNWLAIGGFFSNQPKLLRSTNFGNNWFDIS